MAARTSEQRYKLAPGELGVHDWKNRRRERERCECCKKAARELVWYPSVGWFLCVECQHKYRCAKQELAQQRRAQLLTIHTIRNEAEGHSATIFHL